MYLHFPQDRHERRSRIFTFLDARVFRYALWIRKRRYANGHIEMYFTFPCFVVFATFNGSLTYSFSNSYACVPTIWFQIIKCNADTIKLVYLWNVCNMCNNMYVISMKCTKLRIIVTYVLIDTLALVFESNQGNYFDGPTSILLGPCVLLL